MAVTANSIITPQTPKAACVTTTTSNTTYTDGPTNTATLLTAGANGARVTRIRSIPRATVAATSLQLYMSTDGGTTKKLIDSKLMSAHTVATTTAISTTDWGYSDSNPLILPANAILYVAQAVTLADGIDTFAEWADY